MQEKRAILSAAESLRAQERAQSAFALTASVHKVNVCQCVIRTAVVEWSSVLQSVEIQTASVGLTASVNPVNVLQSARRDAVLINIPRDVHTQR